MAMSWNVLNTKINNWKLFFIGFLKFWCPHPRRRFEDKVARIANVMYSVISITLKISRDSEAHRDTTEPRLSNSAVIQDKWGIPGKSAGIGAILRVLSPLKGCFSALREPLYCKYAWQEDVTQSSLIPISKFFHTNVWDQRESRTMWMNNCMCFWSFG